MASAPRLRCRSERILSFICKYTAATILRPMKSGLSPTFEAPLEMLAACHRRIERQCETLSRLVPHLAAHGADGEARAAAAAVMRYFDTSGMQHHEDEERDLFPAL